MRSLILGLLSLAICSADSGAQAQEQPARPHKTPAIIRERHGSVATTDNWSGYAVTGAPGSVTDVKGSWTVPAIVGHCTSGSPTQYASFWLGIDGAGSNTVEQIGTDSDCQNGAPVYYAWYEFYPHFASNIAMTISVGDTITAEVKATWKGNVTVSLTNETTGKSFSTTVKMPNAKLLSAEWIAEGPGGTPPADFGTVDFGVKAAKGSLDSCVATIGGVTGPIASFPGNIEIEMVSSSGALLAQPSSLSSTTSGSFSVTYVGP